MQPPIINQTPVNIDQTITDWFQYEGGRYQRYKRPLIFTQTAIVAATTKNYATLPLQASVYRTGGGLNVSFQPYTRIDFGFQCVGLDGSLGTMNVRASYVVKGTERVGNAVGAFVDETDGPALMTLFGVLADGTSVKLIEHGVYIDLTGKAKDHPYCWVQNCSNDWEPVAALGDPVYHQYALCKVADLLVPRQKPLIPRLGKPFSNTPTGKNLVRIDVVSGGTNYGVQSTPIRTISGIWHTECRQNYTYQDAIVKPPRLPLLDGPRGVCTTPYTTDLRFGRHGKIYGANPWQAFVIDPTGHKKTLYGLRHKYPITWTEEMIPDSPGWEDAIEIVGNWDASIPIAERFAWESWGMAWDTRTLLPINDSAPIPSGETEHPHTGTGPVHFRTDRHGYVLKVQSDPLSHAVPPTITRWFAADDPWGIDYFDGKLYVSERGKHRISIWSADTPNTYLGDLIADPTSATLGSVDQQNRRWVGAIATVCRTHSIVAPEGLKIQDGYVYWGSYAQGEVRRIPLTGGAYEVVCRPTIDGKSEYVYIDISEGNFGPRGAVGVTSWTIATFGRPQIFVPFLGKDTDGTPLTHAKQWVWQTYVFNVSGRGQPGWDSDSYAAAFAFGRKGSGRADDPDYGALVSASANGNITVYVLADDTIDGPALTDTQSTTYCTQQARGMRKYRNKYQTLHGLQCVGPDYDLPWGQDSDIDIYMKACGFIQGEDPQMIAELQTKLDAANAANAALADEVTKAQQTNTDLTNQVTALTAKLAQLNADIDAAQAKSNS